MYRKWVTLLINLFINEKLYEAQKMVTCHPPECELVRLTVGISSKASLESCIE